MDSRNPRDEDENNPGGPKQEGVRLAAAVRRILTAESISQSELDEDCFLGEESVEEFIQRQKEKP